jgi:hypothetical protein
VNSIQERVKRVEEILKTLKFLLSKEDPFVREILNYVKTDENFFQEFMNFLEKSANKRVLLLNAIKRILIEASEKIYS